jgi:hypothetical protein
LVGTQQTLVCRSQNWNQAIVIAEGGVEEAMALLNSGVQAPNFAVSFLNLHHRYWSRGRHFETMVGLASAKPDAPVLMTFTFRLT